MTVEKVPDTPVIHNVAHSNALAFYALAVALAAALPGATLGALLAHALWRATHAGSLTRWLLGALSVATAAFVRSWVVVAWPWILLAHAVDPDLAAAPTAAAIGRSALVEMLVGPALLLTVQVGRHFWRQTAFGQEELRVRDMAARRTALERGWKNPSARASDSGPDGHPSGAIRLGVGLRDRRPFDLETAEIAQHVFIPGASGTGKTTTLTRLADGALANGYGVVFVDCKGTELAAPARRLADRYHLPFTFVDPNDPATVGYNPCTGVPAAVANKLVGSFSFSPNAEIYKHAAMQLIPIVCRALEAAGEEVTIDRLYDSLSKNGLDNLATRAGKKFEDKHLLLDLGSLGGVANEGMIGLQTRLGALREGSFRDLFRQRPALDWSAVMAEPSVAYFALNTMGAGEDVELFCKVILQDLKQICDQRLRSMSKGADPVPFLLIFDEFAALREAPQVIDLLLQARAAKTPLVLAVQNLPEEPAIRKPALSSGVLLVHRLNAEDAEVLGREFATHTVPIWTQQFTTLTGENEKSTVRWGEEFYMNPNELKQLPRGTAAVYVWKSNRREFVHIDLPT